MSVAHSICEGPRAQRQVLAQLRAERLSVLASLLEWQHGYCVANVHGLWYIRLALARCRNAEEFLAYAVKTETT